MGASPFGSIASSEGRRGAAGIAIAALALLQPGFDPVFLAELSAAHDTELTLHGWIVGATQGGMAAGSLVILGARGRLPLAAFPLAALGAMAASLLTAITPGIGMLLAIRAVYGFAMGLIYTQAMSRAAISRPNSAYGAVFLTQLIIASLVAIALPALAGLADPHIALAGLAIVPATILALLLTGTSIGTTAWRQEAATRETGKTGHSDPAGWALVAACLLFICSTMLVWSSTGALAITAGISELAIGRAVAIGSVVGAVTALFVMRERLVFPLSLTGCLAGLALMSPIAATAFGGEGLFTLSVLLLNIGSTAIIVRTSGEATARARSMLFRRLVATTHSVGMILGPVAAALLTSTWGMPGLVWGAATGLTSGCAALLLSALLEHRKNDGFRNLVMLVPVTETTTNAGPTAKIPQAQKMRLTKSGHTSSLLPLTLPSTAEDRSSIKGDHAR